MSSTNKVGGTGNVEQIKGTETENSVAQIINRSSTPQQENTRTLPKKDSLSNITNLDTDKHKEILSEGKLNTNFIKESVGILEDLTGITSNSEVENENLNKAIKKLSGETSRKKLDKLENLKQEYGNSEILNETIQNLKDSKLGKPEPDNLKEYVDNFIKLTDPGITLSKSRILPLHDALERFSSEIDTDKKVALLNEIKNEIANYRNASPNSSKMQWVNELEKQLPVFEKSLEIDIIKDKIEVLKFGGGDNITHGDIHNIDQIKREITGYKANGNDSPKLDEMLSGLNSLRREWTNNMGVLEKDKLVFSAKAEPFILGLNFNNPQEALDRLNNEVTAIKKNMTLTGNFTFEDNVIKDRILFHAPNLSEEMARQFAEQLKYKIHLFI
jgi:hypothetical protein